MAVVLNKSCFEPMSASGLALRDSPKARGAIELFRETLPILSGNGTIGNIISKIDVIPLNIVQDFIGFSLGLVDCYA